VWTAAGVTVATATGLLLTHFPPLPNVSTVFLLAALFAAAGFGLRPALLASVLSFLSYNFFFIKPLYTFSVAQPQELLALFVLLAVAVLTSAIAGRARDQVRTVIERQKTQKAVPTNAELHSAKRRVPQRSSFVWPRTTSPGRHRIWLRRAPAHLVPERGIGMASPLRRQVQRDRRFQCPCPSRRCMAKVIAKPQLVRAQV
jgi:hypothetical protein